MANALRDKLKFKNMNFNLAQNGNSPFQQSSSFRLSLNYITFWLFKGKYSIKRKILMSLFKSNLQNALLLQHSINNQTSYNMHFWMFTHNIYKGKLVNYKGNISPKKPNILNKTAHEKKLQSSKKWQIIKNVDVLERI